MHKMCILEKLNFKISRGSMPPDPPNLLTPSALDTIWVGLLPMNCFHRSCYFKWVIVNIILRFLLTQRDVSLLSRKGSTFVLHKDIYFKDCWHEVRSSLKCTPPPAPTHTHTPQKLCTRLGSEQIRSEQNRTDIRSDQIRSDQNRAKRQ